MLLPAVQYGDWTDVRKRMRTIVTRIKRGESIVSVMSEDGMLDVGEHPGMLMMGGRILAGGQDFHCFMPWQTLWQTLFDSRTKTPAAPGVTAAIFRESLSVSWGILGLLSFENQVWVYPEERRQAFLDAAIGAWHELDAVGSRYFADVEAKRLWSVPNNLHFVLANMGVPPDLLRAPLPADGPRALLQHARAAS